MLLTGTNGQKFLALKPNYFAKKTMEEVVKEAMEEKKEVEIVIEPEPVPTEEELAEIKKQKLIEEKKAELAELEK